MKNRPVALAARFLFTATPITAADGIVYADSVTIEQGPFKVTKTWSFEAK